MCIFGPADRAVTISIEGIDDDPRERQERGVSFDQVVNEMIRTGLDSLDAQMKRKPFQTRVFSGGEPLFNSPEELKALIARLDEEKDLRKLGSK